MKKTRTIILVAFLSLILIGAGYVLIRTELWAPPRKIATHNWIELDKITQIGKFDSTLGHGYGLRGDAHPTSRKHYFYPGHEWTDSNDEIEVYAPVDGKIIQIELEGKDGDDPNQTQGYQIRLRSLEYPNYVFIFFHQNPEITNLEVGQEVEAGTIISYIWASGGRSCDLAVQRGMSYVSWFDVMSDEVFEEYANRGINSPEDMKKDRKEIQDSANAGYDFENSDPTDIVLLVNTPYSRVFTNNIISPDIATHISYLPNMLVDTGDFSSTVPKSFIEWIRISNETSPTPRTQVRAPFDATIEQILQSANDNYVVKIKSGNSRSDYQVVFWEILDPQINEGQSVSTGQILGYVDEFLGIDLETIFWNVPISMLELLSDTLWHPWSNKGLISRSQGLLGESEYQRFISENAVSGFEFTTDSIWWIELG